MVRLFAVIERDLKKFKRNPIVIAMSVVMPILYLVILGNSFQGKLKNLPLAVVNQSSGPYSERLMENLRAVEAGPATFNLINLTDQRDVIEGVRDGRYKAALIIPSDFDRRVAVKNKAEVGLYLDNTDSISSDTLRGYIGGAVRFLDVEYVAVRERSDAIYLRDIDLYRKVDYYQSLVPGVVIMAIFLGALTTGVFNLVMDRFLGIEESYLLTPLSKAHIVSGLIISGLSITTLLASLILAVSLFLTGIPLSRAVTQISSRSIIIVLDDSCSFRNTTFVILGRANHPRIVVFSWILKRYPFLSGSGAIYPIASFPGWLKVFAKINPEAYAVDALKAILFKNAGLSAISNDIFFLVIFTAVMMTIAIATFKRTL